MDKKLLLINPVNRSVKVSRKTHGVFYQPLGLGIVAALTPDDWEVEIMDEHVKPFEYKEADLIGLTAFTESVNRAYKIASLYRKRGTPVVLGGIHASMLTEEALQYVDTIVIGEAESVWAKLIADFEAGKMQRIYQGERQDLRWVPQPRRDLFHPKCLLGSIQTTRGCPMNCAFCSVTTFNGRQYRKRPMEKVLDELETIPQKYVAFLDDNLIGHGKKDEEYALALFQGIIDRGIEKAWRGQASMNFGKNERLLEYAAKSGCQMVFLGVEAEDIGALKEMNKKVNLEIGVQNYEKVFRRIHQYGIAIETNFIYGMDSDTPEKLRRRTDYILNSEIDVVLIGILTPLPGTKLFDRIRDEGRLLYTNFPDDWCHHSFLQVSHRPALMEPEQLTDIFRESAHLIFSFQSIKRRSEKTLHATQNFSLAMLAQQTNLFRQHAYLSI